MRKALYIYINNLVLYVRYDGRKLTNDRVTFVEEQKSRRFEAMLSVDARFAVSWRIHERRSFFARRKVSHKPKNTMKQLTGFKNVKWSCSDLMSLFWRSAIRRRSHRRERRLQRNELDDILFTKLCRV